MSWQPIERDELLADMLMSDTFIVADAFRFEAVVARSLRELN
jgi:hypothetical protein